MRCCLFVIICLTYLSASAQLNADFSAASIQGCSPFTVQFRDNSTGSPTQWFWDFGNGITSSAQNPTVVYTTAGKYTVRLIVRNAADQDYEQKTNYITVFATPNARFTISSGDSGCAPLQTVFKDTSDFFNVTAKSWLWDFGDGSTSNQQNPAHTFTSGRYNVSLTIETSQGCTSSVTRSNIVRAGNKPVADFSATPLTGCASTIRDFKNKSSGKITASEWSFGDGGISLDKNPQYHYQDTGTFSVKLVVSESGCKDSLTIPDYVRVAGPVAKFITGINCSERFTLHFYDRSIDVLNRQWDFGDNITSTEKNPFHTYTSPGIYIVSLIITGAACSDTARDTIHIKATKPILEASPAKNFYCKYDSLVFSVKDYDTADTKGFVWNFDDGVVRSGPNKILHIYNSAGKFQPAIYIRNTLNCVDTVNLNTIITINGPTANFSVNANGCTDLPIAFKNNSTAFGSPITQWLWSYGDGTTSSTQNPPNYLYAFPGTYNPYLKVTDANNCTDSIRDTINIFQSPVVDAGIDTFACAGNSISLKATGATSYTWQNNPDLSCTNCANPVATPMQASTYYVRGRSNGCSALDSVKVKVQTKELITAKPASFEICEGNSVDLNVSGTDKYSWLPDNTLSNTTINNPVATPIANTVYTVIGKDSNNCFTDTARIKVTVNPNPVVIIPDSAKEVLSGTTYTILASTGNDGPVNLEWLPASGLSCFSCLQPTATVNNTVTYTLTATDARGCTGSDSITLIALCNKKSIYIPNTFSPNNDGVNDYFFPRANGSVLVKSLTIFNRWGQVVYDKRNFYANGSANGWDGKYNNVLQKPDVYVYIIKLVCANNETFTQQGNITLIH
jgi:gliding motility-associated-like protein